MSKHAVIVGAGVGGMTTALRLLRNGWTVDVFEKANRPGGRLNRLEAEGYRFDLGPTIILLPDVLHKLFADLDRKLEDYLQIEALHPNFRLHFSDGSAIDASTNLQQMTRQIEQLSSRDVAGFIRYIQQMHRRYHVARRHFIERPMTSVGDVLHPQQIRRLMKLRLFRSMRRDIETYIRDPRLQDALTFQGLYIGANPFTAPSIFNVIGFMELTESGVWYAKGGFYAVVEAFSKILDEYGGNVHLECPVARVLEDGGRATGVLLEDGREVHADVTIVNADFPEATKTILPPLAQRRFSASKVEKMEQSCSGFMLYLGLNRRYEGVQVHNLYFGEDFQSYMKEVFVDGTVPTNPAIYAHMPSLIDTSVSPVGKDALYILVPVPNLHVGKIDWKTESKRFRNQIIETLSQRGYENLEQHIEFEAMFTPLDWANDFSLSGGAGFGVLPKLSQSAHMRPSLKSDTFRDLYFIGASTHPGSGVTIVMTGSALLERLIAREHREAFPKLHGQPLTTTAKTASSAPA